MEEALPRQVPSPRRPSAKAGRAVRRSAAVVGAVAGILAAWLIGLAVPAAILAAAGPGAAPGPETAGAVRGSASTTAPGGAVQAPPRGTPEKTVRTCIYKNTPQGPLRIWVHLPKDRRPGERRPAIVFFFGGGWRGGKVQQFRDQAAYLASRGMVAARADYRVRSRHGTTPVACVEDAKSAVRWLRVHAEEFGIDPNRVVAAGGSAGGHLAACTALVKAHEPPGEDPAVSSRPNALVLFNPVLDLRHLDRFVQDLDAESRRSISPICFVTPGAPPAIAFYGTEDDFLAQGRAMLARSKACHNRFELYTAEGQRHGFFNRPPWKELTLREADHFLASLGYLKGPPTITPPPGTTERLQRVE